MYHHRGVGQTRNLLHSDCIWQLVDTLNFYDTSCTCHGLLLRPCISRDMTSDDDAPCSYWYSSICHYTHRCSTRPGRGSVRALSYHLLKHQFIWGTFFYQYHQKSNKESNSDIIRELWLLQCSMNNSSRYVLLKDDQRKRIYDIYVASKSSGKFVRHEKYVIHVKYLLKFIQDEFNVTITDRKYIYRLIQRYERGFIQSDYGGAIKNAVTAVLNSCVLDITGSSRDLI